MSHENTTTFVASFRDRNLRTWEAERGHLWEVTNAVTGELITRGESLSREDAMVAAAQAAGADWGSAKWRSPVDDNED